MFSGLFGNIVGGVEYDVFRYLVGPLIMTIAGTAIARRAFGAIQQRKEAITFATCLFVISATLFYFISSPVQQPKLSGSITQILTGAINSSIQSTVAILAVEITNTGNMQTIVKNWKVSAEINGTTYDGSFGQMPPTFTFNDIPQSILNQPTSVTYSRADNVLEKSLTPIQVGALLPGILFVVFENVDPSIFKSGALFTVTYQDVLSRSYSMSLKATALMGRVGIPPGLHTQMACPVPPGGLPKVGNDLLKH